MLRIPRRPTRTTLCAIGVLIMTGTLPADAATSTTTPTSPSAPKWTSSAPLIAPPADLAKTFSAVKDPSVVFVDDTWHVFATTTTASGNYNMVYLSFTDWAQAGKATWNTLDTTPIGSGYRAAPEVFYFAPQKLWYLVYQTGNASYSTNKDISNPKGWTAPQHFYTAGTPDIITENIGEGYWVDMWVICDSTTCYLFSSDDNGHLYRSQTRLSDFPKGFSDPVIAMETTNRFDLFEAANVYKIKDQEKYLLIVEAIGTTGHRYFRSWTSPKIVGPWTELYASEKTPFAGEANVSFPEKAWTKDISHGEMIRDGYDQTLTIDPCDMSYLYQGKDPSVDVEYNLLPWKLGLISTTGCLTL
jgi:endo-1,4-beta-xylanase